MKYLIPIILLVFNLQIFSQDQNMSVFWDFYTNNRLSTINAAKGCTGIASENDISGIILNPANLNIEKKLQVHAEYVYKSDVPWGSTLGFSDMNLKAFHPSFMVAGGYKINDFLQTGLLWYTSNSKKMDVNFETEGLEQLQTMSISSLLLPVVYSYKNIFKAGINLSLLYYHGYANYMTSKGNPDYPQESTVNVFNFNAQIGFLVMPIKGLSVGAAFTPQARQLFNWHISDGTVISDYAPNNFPAKIGIGAEYKFTKIPLRVDFDYNYIKTSEEEGLKDRNDFDFGVEYDLFKQLTLRMGFFTLKDYRQNGGNYHYSDPIGKYDEYFLTIGGTYKIKKYSFSLALLDSHISTGLIKQTLINGGITLDF